MAAVTTKKTGFFREEHHFRYLVDVWAPQRRRDTDADRRRLRLWSAACATGEEAYSLALTLGEAGLLPPTWDVRILATDIDTLALADAEAGRYTAARASEVPAALLARGFERPGAGDNLVARRTLRDLVVFRPLNLIAATWPLQGRFDVIFCRNVLIYFARDVQQRVVERLISYVVPGGLLVLGHAETPLQQHPELQRVSNTIYARPLGAVAV